MLKAINYNPLSRYDKTRMEYQKLNLILQNTITNQNNDERKTIDRHYPNWGC